MNVTNADYFTFNVNNSMLLVGKTGTGKSVLQNKLIERYVEAHTPKTLQFVILDKSKTGFWELRQNHKEYIKEQTTDSEEGLDLLERMAELSIDRLKTSDNQPMIFIHIEECDMACLDQERFDKAIIMINRNAKLANMKLLYSTSSPRTDTVSLKLLDSFELILSGTLNSDENAKYLGVENGSSIKPFNFAVVEPAKNSPELHNHKDIPQSLETKWSPPPIVLLDDNESKIDAGDINLNANIIKDTFCEFAFDIEIEKTVTGARITRYILKPTTEENIVKIIELDEKLTLKLALNLDAVSTRVEVMDENRISIDVPNVLACRVNLASIYKSKEWLNRKSPLSIALGKDTYGKPIITDLALIPNLLLSGQTGSGKTVMLNTIIMSLVYGNSPDNLKLILIDPKQVEFSPYKSIPHLLCPVITEPEQWIEKIRWVAEEAERRLSLFENNNVNSIEDYNIKNNDDPIPYIVVISDEFSDMMMLYYGAEIESIIGKITLKAYATGIHFVISTSRPSTDIYTETIKANFSNRIAFAAASNVDSMTIINNHDAVKLLGQGDFLYSSSSNSQPIRAQGAFVSDDKLAKVIEYLINY